MASINILDLKSSDDAYFEDIRPCHDDEVQEEIRKIIEDRSLVDGIIKFRYKSTAFSWILRPIVKRILFKRYGTMNTVEQFQQRVALFISNMIATTTDGVEFIGFDKLQKDKSYLFISNHRDISLDPALIDYALHSNKLDTVRIAIGDNLLKTQAASSLMRLNKSFIVRRNVSGIRQKLIEFNRLSAYMGLSLKEGHSIWIAQREGRAKDGDDKTDPALLKMCYAYGKAQNLSFKEYMSSLNIIPVAISYEFDPSDLNKARELYEKQEQGSYQKSNLEDLESIASGIKGYKGRICLVAGDKIDDGFDNAEELASLIDKFIYNNYKLYPSSLISANKSESCSQAEIDKFMHRLDAMPEYLRQKVKDMYAKPLLNLEEISNG